LQALNEMALFGRNHLLNHLAIFVVIYDLFIAIHVSLPKRFHHQIESYATPGEATI
jgi:hypothetical protein